MRRLTFLPSLLVLFLSCGVLFLPAKPLAAACSPIANDKGQSSGTVAVATEDQYTLWVRMWAPNSSSDSVFAQVDDQCPVVVNDSQSGGNFIWVNFSDGKTNQPIRYNLTAGSHAITLAGREVGAGVDKILLASDPTCVPTGLGDNCLQSTSTTQPASPHQTPTKTTSIGWPYAPNWWVVVACIVIVIAAGIFIYRLYRNFIKSQIVAVQQPGVVVGSALQHQANLGKRLLHFARHHKLIVAIWAIITLASITVGIVAAASSQPVFEAEAGKLSGGATITSNSAASGGKYVLFQNNPAGQSGGNQQGGGSGQTSGGNNGGGTPTSPGGGGTGGGTGTGGGQNGGGSTPPPAACALPKYPNTSCTGVPAGISYSKTVNTDYFAKTPGQVIDSWHITGDLVIQATGVVIKNSLIDGHVDNDSLPAVTSFTISDSTVGPATCDTQGWPSLNAHDFTATRVFLRGHQDGIDVVGDNVTVSDSFIQPCYQPPEVVGSDGFHSDGVQDQCGGACGHFTFVHNTFDSRAFYNGTPTGNSAIYLGSPYNGTGNNAYGVTLQNNLFLGGGYTTALWWNNVGGGANWIISGNAWVQNSWAYGPDDSVNTCAHQSWSGNTIVTVNANYAVTATVGPSNCIN